MEASNDLSFPCKLLCYMGIHAPSPPQSNHPSTSEGVGPPPSRHVWSEDGPAHDEE